MLSQDIQAFISNDESALFYECGYSCDNAWLLKVSSEVIFITDSRYSLEAKELGYQNIQILESNNLIHTLCEQINKSNIKSLVYDNASISALSLETIRMQCRQTELIPKARFHQSLRMKKTQDEIDKIRKSQALNTKAYELLAEFLCTQNSINNAPITEKTLQFQAKIFLQDFGNYDLSFEPILALNHNAAKPHAIPTNTPLKEGDLILFDAGIKFERYCSDRTRTALFSPQISFDKKQSFKDKKHQKIYDIVLKAQEHAIKNTRAGMSTKEVDALAREVIQEAGYGEFFTHSTGHGIGLDIHEMPFISPRSDTIIEDGMIFSIEPGIYLPGEFGVRIEDLVYIENGCAKVL